MMALGGIF